MTNCVYIVFLCTIGAVCSTRTINKEEVPCKKILEVVLEEPFASTFNPRPKNIPIPSVITTRKYNVTDVEADRGVNVLGREEIRFRDKRRINYAQDGICKSKINFTDLGPDYFPRYLRSVQCLTKNCWFSLFKCRPKSFALKVLKRRRNKDLPARPGVKIGVSGLPKELRELWVWEERVVNSCCECSAVGF